MPLRPIILLACFSSLMSVANPVHAADDPNYSVDSISVPSTVSINTRFQISGAFNKTWYGPTCDRILIEIFDNDSEEDPPIAEYFDTGSKTSGGGFLSTKVNFDTNSLPTDPDQRPMLPSTGNFTVTIRAQASNGSGGWIDRISRNYQVTVTNP